MRKFLHKQDKLVPNSSDSREAPNKLDAISLLINEPGLWAMDEKQRMAMTVSCRDTDYIKKVTKAGTIIKTGEVNTQIMHNGMRVEAEGYHGAWMADIIKDLRGHHEPQEEKAFYEVLRRIKKGAAMIELGSFWAYYSIWFNMQIEDAKNVCCEPDPNNLKLGKRNARLNNVQVQFLEGAAGRKHREMVDVVMDSDNAQSVKVPVLSVDGLMAELGWNKLELLHMDVQGYEYDALQGAINTIKEGKLRFLFVSTHHYFFSHNPNTHAECMEYIERHGGHIITAHTVAESYSGDGLIVASFDEKDKDFKIDMSVNHTDQSLFRPYEKDLSILAKAYDQIY